MKITIIEVGWKELSCMHDYETKFWEKTISKYEGTSSVIIFKILVSLTDKWMDRHTSFYHPNNPKSMFG